MSMSCWDSQEISEKANTPIIFICRSDQSRGWESECCARLNCIAMHAGFITRSSSARRKQIKWNTWEMLAGTGAEVGTRGHEAGRGRLEGVPKMDIRYIHIIYPSRTFKNCHMSITNGHNFFSTPDHDDHGVQIKPPLAILH